MSKLKFEVDFSGFWADDENMGEAIDRIIREECEAEVRKHIKALLAERRSETAKQVAAAVRDEVAKIAARFGA